jgi:hypothetical protein
MNHLINFTRHTRNARWAALALIAVCLFPPPARIAHAAALNTGQAPEVNDEVVILFSSIPVGLARGQTLRINVANVNKQRSCCTNNLKQFGIALHGFNGDVIAQRDEIAIEPGQFHSFDFNRDELPLIGEAARTLQVRAGSAIGFSIVDCTQLTPDDFPIPSRIDNSTGQTDQRVTPSLAERIAVGGSGMTASRR